MRGSLLVAACAISFSVGVLGTLAVAWVSDDDRGSYSKTDPGAGRWFCDDDAEVLATAVLDDGIVTVHVTMQDAKRRQWRVRVPGFGTVLLSPTENGEYVSVATATSDLDDGPKRRIAVRQLGGEAWCRGEVSLT